MADKDTQFDILINRIKNNRVLALIMFSAVVLGAILTFSSNTVSNISTLQEKFFPKKEHIQVSFTLQPYDLITEENQTRTSTKFLPIEVNLDDVKSNSNSAVDQILTIIKPSTQSEINLEIIKNGLHATEILLADISYFQSPIQQRFITEFGGSIILDLDEFFQLSDFFNPTCSCISLTIKDKAGQFTPEFIQIIKNEIGYSFEAENLVSNKFIEFEVNKTVILIEPLIITGENTERVEQVKSQLETTMREELSALPFIQISELSGEDLDKKREELKLLPPSGGKTMIVEQYNVDYIISGVIEVTKDP